MQKVIILALVAVFSVVFAQQPTPCTTPQQWEARVFEYDHSKQYFLRGRISYDAFYQRERIVEERVLDTDDEYFDVLYLHALQTEYRYSFKNRNCTVSPITRPWRDFGIPKSAINYGESYLGSSAVPNGNLLTTIWGLNFNDTQGNPVNYMGVWTYEACLPVSITYRSPAFGALHSTFLDITPGVADPSRFIPRSECLRA